MIQQLQPRENGNKIIRLFSISIAFSLIDIPVVLAVEYDLEYDANGNLIQGKDKYFEYNSFNQLFRVREDNQNGNILEEYFYDHEGNRVLKKVYESGQVTQEIYYIDKNFVQIVNSTGTFNEVYYYDDSGMRAIKKDIRNNNSLFALFIMKDSTYKIPSISSRTISRFS